MAGRYTPGAFTNQNQAAFREPRLLIVTDPRVDHQAITEASYVNIPVIALCDSDSPSKVYYLYINIYFKTETVDLNVKNIFIKIKIWILKIYSSLSISLFHATTRVSTPLV